MTSAIEKSRERDEYRCRLCGSSYNIQSHHLKYRSAGGEDTEDNYLTLCQGCHQAEHDHRIKIHVHKLNNHLEVFMERITK